MKDRRVVIDYTNWRGERREYVVEPSAMFWGSNEWHPEPQWLMIAVELGRDKRTFALKNIHSWRTV